MYLSTSTNTNIIKYLSIRRIYWSTNYFHLSVTRLEHMRMFSSTLFIHYIRLSGFDNSILGYKPRIQRLTRQFQTNIDSAQFGKLSNVNSIL